MATRYVYRRCTEKRWTYGAELELVDWPRNEPLQPGMAVDDGNYTSVNSNGVAVDGPGKLYHLGGEILTAPSALVDGPAEQLLWVQTRWPEATHNYRTGLNVHVRIPGLRDDVERLKHLQTYIHRVMPELLSIIDPIYIPTREVYPDPEEYRGAMNNYRTRKKDHYTLLKPHRLALQMHARTPQEFFAAEAIHEETGEVHWALAPRTCINLRQLMQTDTIEFRHFFMPYTAEALTNTVIWCKMFLEAAFSEGAENISATHILNRFGLAGRSWPPCLPYVPWLDKGWYYTTRRHNSPDIVPARIEDWLRQQKGRKHVGNNELEHKASPASRRRADIPN